MRNISSPKWLNWILFATVTLANADESTSLVPVTRNMLGDEVQILDGDQDGWDDLWKHLFPEINHFNRTNDTDKDGVSDYDEMLLWRDPIIEGPMPRKLTPAEMEEAAVNMAEQKEKWQAEMALQHAKRRAALEPRMQKRVFKLSEEELNKTVRKEIAAIKASYRTARAEVAKWKLDTGFIEPEGVCLDAIEDGMPVFLASDNASAAVQANTTAVQPGGLTGFNLTGQGFKIGVWDGGILSDHNEFTGRYTNRESGTVIAHAKGVVGTMIASGLNPSAKGMSPGATVDVWNLRNDDFEMIFAALDGINLSNHSYSVLAGWTPVGELYALDGVTPRAVWFGDIATSVLESNYFGRYTANTLVIDTVTFEFPEYLSVWSAGNSRNRPMPVGPNDLYYTYQNGSLITRTGILPTNGAADNGFDTISEPSGAKNTLTVGAVDTNGILYSNSSFGPTDDGRIKPDLVAKGVNVFTSFTTDSSSYSSRTGTSYSAPVVTGSINLMRELCFNLGRKPMKASCMKGVVIHTATDLGMPGPDYQFGWGLLNTQKAAELIHANSASDALPHIKEAVLADQDHIEFVIRATGTEPLKVTICWTDKPNFTSNLLDYRQSVLENELHVQMTHGATTYLPWVLDVENPSAPALKGINHVDNVQQVMIANPVAGAEYIVRIDHTGSLVNSYGISGQEVSIVVSGNEVQPAPPFLICDLQQTAAEEFTLCWKSVVGASYQVETSTDLTTWTLEGESLNASREEVVRPVTALSTYANRFWRVVRLAD